MFLDSEKFYPSKNLLEVINRPLLPGNYLLYDNAIITLSYDNKFTISFYSKKINTIADKEYAYLLATYSFATYSNSAISTIIMNNSRFLLWLDGIVIPKLNLGINLGEFSFEVVTQSSGIRIDVNRHGIVVGSIVINDVCKSLLHKLLRY